MGGVREFDGGKKRAGRKRHILVDTQGFLLAVVVHAANLQDRQEGKLVLQTLGRAFPRLQRIWADHGSTGALIAGTAQEHKVSLDVVYPSFRHLQRDAPDLATDLGYQPGFRVIPKRQVVERPLAWLAHNRRPSKDYERLCATCDASLVAKTASIQALSRLRSAV